MLEVEDLCAGYQDEDILHNVSIEVSRKPVAIVGPNGCGKSTLFKAISGLIKPRQGTIALKGKNVTGLDPSEIVRLGLSHVPQGKTVFANMTVKENLEMGAFTIRDKSLIKGRMEQTVSLFPNLAKKLTLRAGFLSGGEQKMLEIARGLMLRPDCLMLDEPSLGLSPLLSGQLFEKLKELRNEITLIVVEQNPTLALNLCSEAYLMDLGRIRFHGACDELVADRSLWKTYFTID